jgi:hypothetical protein
VTGAAGIGVALSGVPEWAEKNPDAILVAIADGVYARAACLQELRETAEATIMDSTRRWVGSASKACPWRS